MKRTINVGNASVEARKRGNGFTVVIIFENKTLEHAHSAKEHRCLTEEAACSLANKVFAAGKVNPELWVTVKHEQVREVSEMVAFIPHTVLSQSLCFRTATLLDKIKHDTGATHVAYHRGSKSCDCCSHHPYSKMEDVYHIVLTNPVVSLTDIKNKYSSNMTKDMPIWYWNK